LGGARRKMIYLAVLIGVMVTTIMLLAYKVSDYRDRSFKYRRDIVKLETENDKLRYTIEKNRISGVMNISINRLIGGLPGCDDAYNGC
jgi:hypothetical protein